MKRLLLYCSFALVFASCSKKMNQVPETDPELSPVTYTIVENFENTADKGGYGRQLIAVSHYLVG